MGRRRIYAPIGTLGVIIVIFGTMSAGPAFAVEPTTEPVPAPVVTTTAPPSSTSVEPPSPPVESNPAATPEKLPDLRISAVYDKSTYNPWDTVGITITVVNAGSAPATEVHAVSHNGKGTYDSWGPVGGPDRRLDPGASVEVFKSVPLRELDELAVTTWIEVRGDEQDANLADNTVTITAPIARVHGTLEGLVYGDRNRNSVVDPGEPLGDVTVNLRGGVPWDSYSQVTDSQGRFAFRDIPAGNYNANFSPAGWVIPDRSFSVHEVNDPDLAVRATRPVSETLTASMAFAKIPYSAGQTAHLVVTLTNTGPYPLTGITAACGFDSDEWGALHGPGVTVPARTTKTFDVPGPIPDYAFPVGELGVRCEFGSPAGSDGGVSATAFGPVLGRVARSVYSSLNLFTGIPFWCPHFTPYCTWPNPVANAKVYIKRQYDGHIEARAVTDEKGEFEFTNVPAGRYDFGVVGPWKIAEGGTFQVMAYTEESHSGRVFVLPGPNQPDPDAVTPLPPAPQAGVDPATRLASTGANVIWLAAGGLLSLLAGFVLVLRRRNAG
jgi:LPXTG-motif cell wall-anchored protein